MLPSIIYARGRRQSVIRSVRWPDLATGRAGSRFRETLYRRRAMVRASGARLASALITGTFITGCIVPQPPGRGECNLLHETRTKRAYWLYLPEDYVKTDGRRADGRKWPLVLTIHGMWFWDSAAAQIREWQQECDRYGFICCAPEMHTCSILMEYPLKQVHGYVKRDENCVLAILDDIFRRTEADPDHVLVTSWSCGGYMAHYMVNRHPDRFSCLVVKQSNFSAEILDSQNVPGYKDMGIGIFYTQKDFNVCRKESEEAIKWYQRHGCDVTAGVIDAMGHERTPEVAAALFAETCNAQPKTAPDMSRIQMAKVQAASGRESSEPVPGVPETIRPASADVRVSSAIGVSPLWISFSVDLPPAILDGADFLWMDNGRPFCYSRNGSTVLTKPGEHRIEVLIVTEANQELTGGASVTVLPPRPPERPRPE